MFHVSCFTPPLSSPAAMRQLPQVVQCKSGTDVDSHCVVLHFLLHLLTVSASTTYQVPRCHCCCIILVPCIVRLRMLLFIHALLAERGLPGGPHVSVQDNPASYGTIVEAAPYLSHNYSSASDEVYQSTTNCNRYIPGTLLNYHLPPRPPNRQ